MAHFNLASKFAKVNFVNITVGETATLVLVGTGPDPALSAGVRLWPVLYEERTAGLEIVHGLEGKKLPPTKVPAAFVDGRDVLLKVTGRNPGNDMLFAREGTEWYRTPVGRLWGETQIVVGLPKDTADLVYSGTTLVWKSSLPPSARGQDPLYFPATSGLGRPTAGEQNLPNMGPVPPGSYSFLAAFDPLQSTISQANARTDGLNNAREGIQAVPTTDPKAAHDWGRWRVRLTRQGQTHGRDGFYLHDSHKGHTHGCIEVGPDKSRTFFDYLIEYASDKRKPKLRLTLRVVYGDRDAPTKGDTAYPDGTETRRNP
jgi:hypothetical protein